MKMYGASLYRNGGSVMLTVTKALPEALKRKLKVVSSIPVLVRVIESSKKRIVLEIIIE